MDEEEMKARRTATEEMWLKCGGGKNAPWSGKREEKQWISNIQRKDKRRN